MHDNGRKRRVRAAVRATALVASLVTAVVVSLGSGGAGLAAALSSMRARTRRHPHAGWR